MIKKLTSTTSLTVSCVVYYDMTFYKHTWCSLLWVLIQDWEQL